MCESRLSYLVSIGLLGKVSGDTMGCKFGKQLQFSYLSSQTVSSIPFDLVHFDV